MDFSQLDGSGRTPRPNQVSALQQLTDVWDKSEAFAVVSPVGSGKTFLARTIHRVTNAAVITASNLLVHQYASEYPMNAFMGADNYPHRFSYEDAREKACDPRNHNVFNPMSWLVAKRQKDFVMPHVIIFDECHSAVELLKEVVTKIFPITANQRFRDNLLNPENFKQFLLMEIAEAKAKLTTTTYWRTVKQLQAKIDKTELIFDTLDAAPEALAIFYRESQPKGNKKRYWLCVKPVTLPKYLIDRFFGEAKVILLSATLLPCDVRELLGGRPYLKIDTGSNIPVERRKIYYRPLPQNLSMGAWQPRDVSVELDKLLAEVPLRPAIIHCTYGDAVRISQFLKTPHLTHTKHTKSEVLQEWMENGGVLLGSGMAEGLDLKGDLCRLNIVLKLSFPHLGDPYIQKRMALSDGQHWYTIQAIKHIVQAVGRSTRSENDWSLTFILDNRFAKVYRGHKEDFPIFFREAVEWTATPPNFGNNGSEKPND